MLRRSIRFVLATAEFDVPASGLRSFDEPGGICSASIPNPDLPRWCQHRVQSGEQWFVYGQIVKDVTAEDEIKLPT